MIVFKIRPIALWSFISWFGWLSVVGLFMLDPLSPLMGAIGWFSLFVSTIFIFKSPTQALYLLPLPLLIGPVLSLQLGNAGVVSVGDLYSAILVLRVFLSGYSRLNITSHPVLLFALLLLVSSGLLASDLSASLIGLLKILQYALIIWSFKTLLKTSKVPHCDFLRNIFGSWTLITSICSIMLLWYFFKGQPLFLLSWASRLDTSEVVDWVRFDGLLRTSFFYTNFFIPLGMSLLYALFAILKNIEQSKLIRILLFISIPINLAALVLNDTRAMLIPVILLGGMAMFWYFLMALSKLKHLLGLMLFGSLILIGGFYVLNSSLFEGQIYAWKERANNSESVEIRLNTWAYALEKTFDEPVRLLTVGWGPQATTRQNSNEITKFFARGGSTEGAFDSTFIGLIFEYGVIFTSLLLLYIAVWFYRIGHFWVRTRNSLVLSMLIMATAVCFTCIFQQFSISPPSLIVMQIFSFSPVFRRFFRSAPDAKYV